MLTRQLGQTPLNVTAIGLGTMPLTMTGAPDVASAKDVIQCFVAGGGQLIDCANVYTEHPATVGENEQLVAAALDEWNCASSPVIATKGGLRRTLSGWELDTSPAWLQQSCDASRQALATDTIQLYQLHAPDPEGDIREAVTAMCELQQQGKIRYLGLCNVDCDQIAAAQEVATITTVQNALHPRRKKAIKQGVVEYCQAAGISFIAHSPVGGYHQYKTLHQDPVLLKLAEDYDTTPASLSLAWLLALGVIPIPGARRRASVEASLASLAIQLSADTIETMNQLEDW